MSYRLIFGKFEGDDFKYVKSFLNYSPQIQAFLFFCKILGFGKFKGTDFKLDKLEGDDFKYDNSFF